MSEAQKAWVYIVECADRSLYTGWTYDVAARVERHNSGLGAKYTRARLPVRLVYREELSDKIEAMRREWHLKRLTRAQKQRLIAASCGGTAPACRGALAADGITVDAHSANARAQG